MISIRIFAAVGFCALVSAEAQAAELCPKYGECVPAASFQCEEVDRSSFITRVCYDAAERYMIMRLEQTDYHYCEVDAGTHGQLMSAPSMGRFYNANIKSSGSGRRFDCRDNPPPDYR